MRIFDRYLGGRFLKVYFLASLVFIAIYQVVDLFEKSDEWAAIGFPVVTIIDYYLNRTPEIFVVISLVSAVMAVLFGLGRLVKGNEFTAMVAVGVSPYRVIIPLLVMALFVSFFTLFIGETVTPEASRRANAIERMRRGEVISLTNLFLYGKDGSIFFIKEFNRETNTITGLEVLRFSQDGALRQRINAEEAMWQNGHWILYRGFVRDYVEGEVASLSKPLTRLDIEETPADFLRGEKKVAELTFCELTRRIMALRESGFLPREELVEIHSRASRPFGNFVVALISIPFAIGAKQVGAAAGFGGALGLALIYLVLFNLGQLLGKSVLPPAVGVWSVNVIFIVVAGWLMKKKVGG